jgi:formate hydrogenlyase transcriptional activator
LDRDVSGHDRSNERKFGKQIDQITPETMQCLENYHWPGNVREMQNVIERAVILSTGSLLNLDSSLQVNTELETAKADAAPRPVPSSKLAALDVVTKNHILSVLAETSGVVDGPTGAAKILGIHPNTLRSRMRKLGITRTPPKTS